MTKEQEIKRNMEILGLTRDEAETLYNDDHSDEVLPEVAEMEKKAETLNRHYEKSETKKRKAGIRKPKEDPEKEMLVDYINKALALIEVDNLQVVNKTQKIDFTYKEVSYSVTLTKHKKVSA